MINHNNNECETNRCQYDSATRPRFYNGMLLTEEHLRTEQDYHREALKRINRYLFGSGIVCGLEVQRQERSLCIKVQPGVALDCCGNLIEVCKCVTVDLSKECKDRFGTDCIVPGSQTTDQFIVTKYVVLRYREKLSDPEPVLTTPDDCKSSGEKQNCEASKTREGFCIELWDKCPCPESYAEPDKNLLTTLQESRDRQRPPANTNQVVTGTAAAVEGRPALPRIVGGGTLIEKRDCIDLPLPCMACGCCEDTNAVGLAVVKIDCAKNTLEVLDCTCRRYVISPRMLTWLFSRLQSHNYLPGDMKETYAQLGYLPTAHMIATAVTFEADTAKIKELDQKVNEDLEARLKAIEEKLKGADQADKPARKVAKKPDEKPEEPPATPEKPA